MKELNFNNTSLINSLNYSNMTFSLSHPHYVFIDFTIANYVNWITIAIGLPLIIIVMIAVFFQVKNGQDAPVYIINLLVSDIVQLCCRISLDFVNLSVILLLITLYALMVSVGFMMCVSCERYLVIAKPLWYRFRRNIKTYVVVCIVVWVFPLLALPLTSVFAGGNIFIVFLLLPFPLFIFFLVGTIKALSGALNVPADEKRRIAAIQVVVLLIYTLLYLPIIILLLNFFEVLHNEFAYAIGLVCIFLSPLADTTLYLFSRKSIMDKFLASNCSCKILNN